MKRTFVGAGPSRRLQGRMRWLCIATLVSRGAFLGVVGRNAAGTAYAERYTSIEGRLQRDTSVALTHPSLWMQTAMTGGTYDVLGWLGNRYRVHAALADNGTLYAALVVRYPDLSGVDALLARRISNFEMGGLLLPMLVSGERCLYGGLSRGVGPPAGRSEPTLFEVGGTPYTLASTHGSTVFQALAPLPGGRCPLEERGRLGAASKQRVAISGSTPVEAVSAFECVVGCSVDPSNLESVAKSISGETES